MTDIRQLLMEANPVPDRVEVPALVRAEVFAEVRRTPPPTRRRWPLPTILIALVAAGGVATAGGLLISQATKDKSTALTGGRSVNGVDGAPLTYGQQIKAQADRFMATTPYPPGMPDTFDWASYSPGAATAPGQMAGTVRELVEHRAVCLWRAYWLKANERRQTSAASQAATILQQALKWPSLRVDRGEGTAIERRAARAAAAGDATTVKAVSRQDCRGVP